MTKSTPPLSSTDPATRIGRAWAEEVRAALHRDGRSANGGWPGTMREARQHAARSDDALCTADREAAVHALYAAARSHWLVLRDRSDTDG